VLQAHRSTYHYRAHGDEQAELKTRIKEIAERVCAMDADASTCSYAGRAGK